MNGDIEKVTYIELEYAPGGELFDMIALGGLFSEKMARFYFRQLIISLEYIHNEGYAHRDLKPENLLFGKNFNLKLADFGFAKALDKEKMKTHLGT